jgi:hypothetical protein
MTMRDSARLQTALGRTTETLARELAQPTRQAPAWSDYEWSVARAVAAMHGVSPLLSLRLGWTGPANWTRFLRDQHHQTARRHARILALLARLDEHTRRAGIATVALKGVALHAPGLYAPGERPMADIDLLVLPQDTARTACLLESLQDRGSVADWKEQVFAPIGPDSGVLGGGYGEHADNPIKIELHHRICERLPWDITDVTADVYPAHSHPGINAYPSQAALMKHLLFHAAGATAFKALRLLHLHDIATLAAHLTEADWSAVLRQHAPGDVRWLWPPLYIASLYYPLPHAVLAEARRACPRHLVRIFARRTLSDVSYSHLPVNAFPGVEWARSPSEVVRYLASRVRPSPEHLAARRRSVTTEAWAKNTAWPAMSQGRRVVSFFVSRPGRAVTLYSVQAALAETS